MPTKDLDALFSSLTLMGPIEYERMGGEGSSVSLVPGDAGVPKAVSRLHRILKGAAQLQIFLGLATLALGALADYVATANGGLRVPYIPELCAAYFIISGLVGVCGSASFRRGLVTAFVVMAVHSALFFVPFLVGSSVASLTLSARKCYLETGAGFLNILCGSSAAEVMEGNPEILAAVSADGRLEWGLVGMGAVQFALALSAAVIGMNALCESFGVVDINAIHQINKLTAYGRETSSRSDVSSVSGAVDA